MSASASPVRGHVSLFAPGSLPSFLGSVGCHGTWRAVAEKAHSTSRWTIPVYFPADEGWQQLPAVPSRGPSPRTPQSACTPTPTLLGPAPPEAHTISGLGSSDPSQQAAGCEACDLELAPGVWEDHKPSLRGRSRWAAGSRQDGVRTGGCGGRRGLGVSKGACVCPAAPLGPRALAPSRPAGIRPRPPVCSGGPGETGWARACGRDFL